ncbi:MAG: FadR family transcriptional regulator [Comamonadaceae bacterium]|nr:MAG: FadR family transcriptional regulator [Comamonadaceae bacterium]
MADIQYEVVQTSRAFEEVMAQLRRLTLDGQLKPGDRLPAERDLAVKLGVSRNTVREALRGLEMSGVLQLRKGAHGGAFLIAPNGGKVSTALQDMFQLGSVTPAQLTEARLFISASVVRVACQRIREEDIRELEASVEKARLAGEEGDLLLRSRTNLQFHRILARSTDNPIFVAVMNGLIDIMSNFIDTLGPPDGTAVYESRARFIAALRSRDADSAVAEMGKYLQSVHRDYLSRLENKSGAGEGVKSASSPQGAAGTPKANNAVAQRRSRRRPPHLG